MLVVLHLNLDLPSQVVTSITDATDPVPTSGTISETAVTTQDLIDHAIRRCGKQPSEVSGENLDTAARVLHMFMTSLANRGIALWALEHEVLAMTPGVSSLLFPSGTVDVLDMRLRTLTKLTGTPSVPVLDDGSASTFYNFGFSGGEYVMTPAGASRVTTVGFLPATSSVWDVSIQYSADNQASWTEVYHNESLGVAAGAWTWFDVQGIVGATDVRAVFAAGTGVSVKEVYFGHSPREIPINKINRTQYASMPDKTVLGRPVQFWLDLQRTSPVAHLWPTPSEDMRYAQVTTYIQRHMQDVGDLSQVVEVPRRWYMAIVNNLAKELALELPNIDPARRAELKIEAQESLSDAWAGQSDGARTQIRVNLRGYQ